MPKHEGAEGRSAASPVTGPPLRTAPVDELARIGAELVIGLGIAEPELTCLAHSHNVTFRVDGLHGGQRRSYSLRLYRPVLGAADRVAAESRILSHLHEHDVPAPVPVLDPAGSTVHVTRAGRYDQRRTALLCHWIEGEIPTAEAFQAVPDRLGRELARVHEALAALDAPLLRAARPLWDATGMDGRVVGADPGLADTIATRVERTLLQRARSTAGAALDGLALRGHRASLIHSDPRRANVLVSSGQFAFIDFEGCGWGQPAYDLAVLLSDILRDQPHVSTDGFLTSALTAYREVRELSTDQEAAVAPLLAGRLAIHLTWYLSSSADPVFPRDANFRHLQTELLARTLRSLRTNTTHHRLCHSDPETIPMTSSKHTETNVVDRTRQVAVVVDGYAMGKYLPEAFAAYDIDVVHVQSTPSWMKRLAPPDLTPYQANIPWTNEHDVAARLRQYRPIAVVPGIEPGVPAADRLSELLKLPTNGSALSAARRNKYLMIERLREAGLRCANQVLATSVDEVVAWAQARDQYPVVVKPLTSASTDGVYICHNGDDVAHAAKDVLSSSTIFDARNTHVLAQSFLDGEEYIVDTVSRDGRHYVCGVWRMDKIFLGPNKKIYGRDVLIDPDTELVERLGAYTRDVLDALGITHGPGHAEVMMTSEGPALVEIGARMDGHLHVDFHQRCLGHDQAQLTALAYADPERFIATYANGCYRKHQEAILFSAHSARTGHVDGLEPATVREIENLPSLQLLVPLLRPGSVIAPTVDQLLIPFRAYLAGNDWQLVEKDYLRIEELQDRLYRISESASDGPEERS